MDELTSIGSHPARPVAVAGSGSRRSTTYVTPTATRPTTTATTSGNRARFPVPTPIGELRSRPMEPRILTGPHNSGRTACPRTFIGTLSA
ncbi:hypothetical protein GCM10009557_60760 [Virgisporangium ochraceum]|uniref:Uncharacterized protein n=1 Tax=Virgisporangium ochraceum TaxID=65505 RepID=A0A8J3ZXW4_9ACTN|nr:hypothetical protein Voc01_061250 [Virgisporangium ochraceum]